MIKDSIIVVVLNVVSSNAANYSAAQQALADWARRRHVRMVAPDAAVGESARFAYLWVESDVQFDSLIDEIVEQVFVETAYVKPDDELP